MTRLTSRTFVATISILLLLSGARPAAATGRPGRWLTAGSWVKVSFRLREGGIYKAKRVQVRDAGARKKLELRGVIASPGLEGGRLRLEGFPLDVVLPSGVRVEAEEGAEPRLDAGRRVKLTGRLEGARLFVVTHALVRAETRPEWKIVGPIEAIEPVSSRRTRIHVAGIPIVLTRSSTVEGAHPRRVPVVRDRVGNADEDDFSTGGTARFPWLRVGGEARLRVTSFANPDLDPGTDSPSTVGDYLFTSAVAVDRGAVFGYVELQGSRQLPLAGELLKGGPDLSRFGISEAYLEWRGALLPNVSLAIGRQKFDDARDWYYNRKNLDAVRILVAFPSLTVEGSISRDLFDVRNNLRDQQHTNRILQFSWDATRAVTVEGFWIDRRDRTVRKDSPRWFGLRLLGEPGRHLSFWTDASVQSGTRSHFDDAGRLQIDRVHAHAVDAGLMLRPRWRGDPTLNLGWARASGDNDLTDGEDGNFRQTGWDRNRSHFNGVVSFRYYGVALSPELSNMRITTAGIGLRPKPSLSLDLIFHTYRQPAASISWHGTRFQARPKGIDPDIGREWDLVVGYEPSWKVEVKANFGRFSPGRAFAPSTRATATVARLQIKFRF